MTKPWVRCPDCAGTGIVSWSRANELDLPTTIARGTRGIDCSRCAGGGDVPPPEDEPSDVLDPGQQLQRRIAKACQEACLATLHARSEEQGRAIISRLACTLAEASADRLHFTLTTEPGWTGEKATQAVDMLVAGHAQAIADTMTNFAVTDPLTGKLIDLVVSAFERRFARLSLGDDTPGRA